MAERRLTMLMTPGAFGEDYGYGAFVRTICGGAPVPTLPRVGYAVLALALLAGSLTLLTLTRRT